MARSFKITCTYYYYGYPQAERRYNIEGCASFAIVYKGNQGWGLLQPTSFKGYNGDYWDLSTLRKAIVSRDIDKVFKLKENETQRFEFEE